MKLNTEKALKNLFIGIGIIASSYGGIVSNNIFITIGGIALFIGELMLIYGQW